MTAAKAAFPLGLLLVAPFHPKFFAEDSCLSNFFYGTYQDINTPYSIFNVPDQDCYDVWDAYFPRNTPFVAAPKFGDDQLVWLQQDFVEESLLKGATGITDDFLASLLSSDLPEPSGQEILTPPRQPSLPMVLHRSPTSMLISVSPFQAQTIDTLLPPFWKSSLLPTTPTPYHAVSPSAIDAVKKVLANLKFDPVIASIVCNISIPQMRNDIRFLTGEDHRSGIVSRHSFSPGALTAAKWLKARFENTGAECTLKYFLEGFAPNVVCRYSAVNPTNDTILISGHYDSRGSFGSTRAPGANDDGSGTTGVLAIARTIARKGVKFTNANVELVAFAGEEQGLLGSRAYAKELRAANASLTLMIQADMTAYRAPGEPIQLGLPERIGTPEVSQLVRNISQIYSPELHVGLTPVCCSDHQSFLEQGYPVTQLFERVGRIADPMYHNSHDLSGREGYDFDQIYSIAKVQFATVLHAAGYELWE